MTSLVARELLLGSATFTEIRRGLPRIPRATTLSSRLRALATAGIIELAGGDRYGKRGPVRR